MSAVLLDLKDNDNSLLQNVFTGSYVQEFLQQPGL
jgi:hypothetical protein